MRSVEVQASATDERAGHDGSCRREAYGQDPCGREETRHVFHDDERASPDYGSYDDEDPIAHAIQSSAADNLRLVGV